MKNIGLIGCGNIAETYFRAQEYFNNIKAIKTIKIILIKLSIYLYILIK